MRVKDIRSNEERTILTSLIVHTEVLATLHSRLSEERHPFENKWSNLICRWCFDYFAKYRKAPCKHIQQIFARYADKAQDEDTVGLIEAFLSRLSKDYEALSGEMNEKYLIDLASNYFERIRLSRCAEDIQKSLESKDLEEAKATLASYTSIDFSSKAWANPFAKHEIKETLRYYEKDRTLIQFPGALQTFLSPHFERDAFIAFAAPEKRGKSYWLGEVVYQALRQRRKVLYYVLGDMSDVQVKRRLYSRITRRPPSTTTVKIPRKIKVVKGVIEKVWFRTEEREGLTGRAVWEASEKLRQATATKELPLKLKCAGASVLSATDIERDMEQLTQEGFVPDVVVIDYADLLASEPGSKNLEFRHQVNESWKVLRRIALDYHCLVCTATQAAATSYDANVIRKKDFSEDKRKNAHVTGMLGINQNAVEKQLGVYRLNWVFLRDGQWADAQVVWTAGCLSISAPAIKSYFASEVLQDNEEE